MFSRKIAVLAAAGVLAIGGAVSTQAATRKHTPTKTAVVAAKTNLITAKKTSVRVTSKKTVHSKTAHRALVKTSKTAQSLHSRSTHAKPLATSGTHWVKLTR
jgi:hypothetical protein